MRLDVDRLADEMLRGTEALMAKAMAPVLAENAALREANERLAKRLDAIEAAPKPDLSSLATRRHVSEIWEAVNPTLQRAQEGTRNRFATVDDLGALQSQIADLAAKGAAPDLSSFATKDDLAEVARSIPVMPEPPELPQLPDIPAMVEESVALYVERAVAAIPRPENGEKGEKGDDGRDGIGLAGALIDRDGALVVTLTNGEAKSLGPVVGRDGDKGEAGRDGTDGVGFDDLDVLHDGERGFTFRFTKGERVVEKNFELPVVFDRGVYAAGKEYAKGDGVTYGGSFWIAQEPTNERPDGGKGWRLSVKKGRDGRDATLKPDTPPEPLKVG